MELIIRVEVETHSVCLPVDDDDAVHLAMWHASGYLTNASEARLQSSFGACADFILEACVKKETSCT